MHMHLKTCDCVCFNGALNQVNWLLEIYPDAQRYLHILWTWKPFNQQASLLSFTASVVESSPSNLPLSPCWSVSPTILVLDRYQYRRWSWAKSDKWGGNDPQTLCSTTPPPPHNRCDWANVKETSECLFTDLPKLAWAWKWSALHHLHYITSIFCFYFFFLSSCCQGRK